MQGWHVWLLIELLPSVCKVLGSILSTGTGGTGQETTQQLSGHSYLKSKAQAILRGHVEGGGVLVIFNKISIIWFTSEDSGARCWGKTLLERQRKHPADLPPQHTSHQDPRSHTNAKKQKQNKTKNKKQTSFKFNVSSSFYLLYPSPLSLSLPDYLLLYFFLNNSMFTSCQLVACSISWPMIKFI